MIVTKKATTTLGISSSLSIAAILVTASLASIVGGMMQTDAAAQGNTIFKQNIRGNLVAASETFVEGSIETEVFTQASTTSSGDIEIILTIIQVDTSTDTTLVSFFGTGPADEFTVANGLGSASFSGAATGFDFVTSEEVTFTVDVDLTATGNPERAVLNTHVNTPDFKLVQNLNIQFRPASGSLDVSGEGISLSTDDATGQIGRVRSGTLVVEST